MSTDPTCLACRRAKDAKCSAHFAASYVAADIVNDRLPMTFKLTVGNIAERFISQNRIIERVKRWREEQAEAAERGALDNVDRVLASFDDAFSDDLGVSAI